MKNETRKHKNTDSEIDEKELYNLYKMGLDKKEWRNRVFEIEIIYIYVLYKELE